MTANTLRQAAVVLSGWAALSFSTAALADGAPEVAGPAPVATTAAQPATPAVPPVVTKKKAKGGNREKDADGTEAPNRFQADTVIKSQYKLDGKQLEVDPD